MELSTQELYKRFARARRATKGCYGRAEHAGDFIKNEVVKERLAALPLGAIDALEGKRRTSSFNKTHNKAAKLYKRAIKLHDIQIEMEDGGSYIWGPHTYWYNARFTPGSKEAHQLHIRKNVLESIQTRIKPQEIEEFDVPGISDRSIYPDYLSYTHMSPGRENDIKVWPSHRNYNGELIPRYWARKGARADKSKCSHQSPGSHQCWWCGLELAKLA